MLSEHTFGRGFPKYLILRRNGAHLHLSEHTGDAPPNGVAYMWVDDVESIAAEFGIPSHEEAWGRELELTDPAGNRLRICEPADE